MVYYFWNLKRPINQLFSLSQREEECLHSMYHGLCHPLASMNVFKLLKIVLCCG